MKIAINGIGVAGPTLAYWLREYVLAGELHRAGGDHTRAFSAYERQLQQFLAGKQAAARPLLGFFAPKTTLGVKARDLAVNLTSLPLVTDFFIGRSLRDDFELPTY